jgi:hypothetical protein
MDLRQIKFAHEDKEADEDEKNLYSPKVRLLIFKRR